jgi:hypothetical protein
MLLRLQYASRCGLGRSCCRHHASRRQPSLVVPAVCALHQQQQQQQQLVQPVVLRSSSSHAAGPPPRHRAVAAHASTGSSSPTAAAAAAATAAEQTQPPPPPVEAFPEMVLQLPPPANSLVKRAEFVKSSVEVAQCPPPRFPEFAVIGRSNVGKSSLINMLTNRKSLAMVSKQPGVRYVCVCVWRAGWAGAAAASQGGCHSQRTRTDLRRPCLVAHTHTQVRRGASTTFASMTAGISSTCPAMGEREWVSGGSQRAFGCCASVSYTHTPRWQLSHTTLAGADMPPPLLSAQPLGMLGAVSRTAPTLRPSLRPTSSGARRWPWCCCWSTAGVCELRVHPG